MHPNVKDAMESLHPAFEKLLESKPYKARDKVPCKGIYLFTEQGRHLYVGRSNRLYARRSQHCQPSSSFDAASFAMLIARKETSTYRKGEIKITRKELLENEIFIDAFIQAKLRVSKMDFRYVEEEDQIRQALLEIYVATALQTPFNEFETH